MYKVFISDSSVILTDKEENSALKFSGIEQLESIYHRLKESEKVQHIVVYHDDLEELWKAWCSNFVLIEAAGGLVLNSSGQVLLIYRLEKWDLPKGKLEEGENPAEAAVREVMEECSVPAPQLTKKLQDTYHTYELKNKLILKKTYWFEMQLEGDIEPAPQIEEDITEVRWVERASLPDKMANTYPNIELLLIPYSA